MANFENIFDSEQNFNIKTSISSVITTQLGLESTNSDLQNDKRRRVAREKAVGTHRLLLLIGAFIHIILLLFALGLASGTRTSLTNALRIFYLIVAFVLNISAPVVLMTKDIYFGMLGQLIMSLTSLVLEMSMFALVAEDATVFIVGISSVVISCLKLIVAVVGLESLLRIAPESTTEENYTNFASKKFWVGRMDRHKELESVVEELLKEDGIETPPEDQLGCKLLVARAFKVVTERAVDHEEDYNDNNNVSTSFIRENSGEHDPQHDDEFDSANDDNNPMIPPPGTSPSSPSHSAAASPAAAGAGARDESTGGENSALLINSVEKQQQEEEEEAGNDNEEKKKSVRILAAPKELFASGLSKVQGAATGALDQIRETAAKSGIRVVGGGDSSGGGVLRRQKSISVSNSSGWASWHAANRIRHLMYRNDRAGSRILLIVLLVVTFLCVGNIIFEFAKIFMNQPETIPSEVTAAFNDLSLRTSYFPSRSHSTWKVHLVVMDGLREDMLDSGASDLGDYINSADFAAHSLRLKAQSQIPTFSVPNWMSILTGSTPEMHGVTGNLGNSETAFDHIFAEAKDYGLHAGMTGTPWWKSLVFSTLPPLDGDGTVESTFNNGSSGYDWISANPGDEERLRVALKAARRSTVANPFGADDVSNLYDLFLTHFSDIDNQGHEYGVETQWNIEDTYQGAISNKTIALKRIIDTIDSNTVLILTSDHGHVKQGGHGGISEVLKDVPLVFFAKDTVMNLTAYPAREFTSTTLPRSDAPEGAFQNLDICATITALLGIPAPRQTQGIFVEEALEALLPNDYTRSVHFHDLYMAKRASVGAFADYLKDGLFADRTQDSLLTSTEATLAFNTTSQKSNTFYATKIRELDVLFKAMRDEQASYAFFRNLLASLLIIAPLIICVCYIFNTKTAFKVNMVLKNPIIMRAFLAGFITLLMYLIASIVIFLVGYFGIVGYTVWDSTLVHTVSAIRPFLQGVLLGPIVVYLVLTKLYLAPLIQWNLLSVKAELKEEGGITLTTVLRWITYLMRDIVIFLGGTRRYRANRYGDAYLYLLSLVFWTLMVSLIISILLFPFTYIVPIVLSSNYVDDFNLEWRFRLITLLMMMLPIQVGSMVLLSMRPRMRREELILWDECFIKVHMSTALRQLTDMAEQQQRQKKEEHNKKKAHISKTEETRGANNNKIVKLTERLSLLKKSMLLLCAPEFRVHSEDIHQNGYFPLGGGD